MACASCCDPPPTEAPTLEGRTASKSLSKCGVVDPDEQATPPVYYTIVGDPCAGTGGGKEVTTTHSRDASTLDCGSDEVEGAANPNCCSQKYTDDNGGHYTTQTFTYGGSYSYTDESGTYSGSLAGAITFQYLRDDSGSCFETASGGYTLSGSGPDGGGSCTYDAATDTASHTGDSSGDCFLTFSTNDWKTVAVSYSGEHTPAEPTTYSSPYVTATLKSEVMANLPALGDWGAAAGTIAASNLTAQENSYSAVKGEWRVVHSPPGTCYLKVWVDQTFTPDDDGEATVTEVVYEWDQTSGAPCVTVPTENYFGESNKISGPENAVAVPATHGDVTVELARWSFIKGYAPGPGEPNGFPPPGWTP